jgi:hypothetical protein
VGLGSRQLPVAMRSPCFEYLKTHNPAATSNKTYKDSECRRAPSFVLLPACDVSAVSLSQNCRVCLEFGSRWSQPHFMNYSSAGNSHERAQRACLLSSIAHTPKQICISDGCATNRIRNASRRPTLTQSFATLVI